MMRKLESGAFRHIIIKSAIKTNEIMCIFVLGEASFPKEEELVKILINQFKNIKTIVKNVNMKPTNVILGNQNVNLYGNRNHTG